MKFTYIPSSVSIPFTMAKDYPVEFASDKGANAVAGYYCAYASVDSFCDQVLGWIIGSGDSYVLRMPMSFPITGMEHYLATECDIEGRGTASSTYWMQQHQKALVKVKFDPFFRKGSGADWMQYLVSEDFKPTAEFRTLGTRKLFWDALGTKLVGHDEGPAIIDFAGEWLYTIHRLPAMPIEFNSMIGKSNLAAVVSRKYGWTWDAETLLYETPEVSSEVDKWGRHCWTVTLRMLYRPLGWNKFWRSGYTTPQIMYVGGVQYKPFTPTDFSSVLVAEAGGSA